MDWLTLIALVLAVAVGVFAVVKDRQNNEVVLALYELIDALLDEVKKGGDDEAA